MTDLLTSEERKKFESVRHRWQHEQSDSIDTGDLIAIIDNLSKRGAKKYTRAELAAEYNAIMGDAANGFTEAYAGFILCARFLGALEEK